MFLSPGASKAVSKQSLLAAERVLLIFTQKQVTTILAGTKGPGQ